jgi:hypothetical protein
VYTQRENSSLKQRSLCPIRRRIVLESLQNRLIEALGIVPEAILFVWNECMSAFGISSLKKIFNFPHHTVVITALLYVFGECECHRLEYLAWFSTTKSVGSLRSPNLEILVQFFKKQTDSARSGFESDIQFYLLGGQLFLLVKTHRFLCNFTP